MQPGPTTRRTAFALAEVIPEPDRPWRRLLRLDGEDVSHVDLRDPRAIDFPYVRKMADAVDLLRPPQQPVDAVHIGGGGFTLPRYIAATRPGSRQTVAEIDEGIVELARTALALPRTPSLKVRVVDGLRLLQRRGDRSADLVVLDAFQNGSQIPPQLAGPEFVDAARRVLRPHGLLAVNVIDEPPTAAARAYARALADWPGTALITPRKVFRDRQGGNLVLLASPTRLPSLAKLRARALRGASPELLVTGDELAAWRSR